MQCPICNSQDAPVWRRGSVEGAVRPEDLRITDAHYGRTLTLRKCRACSFIFADSKELARLTELYEALDDTEYVSSQEARALQMEALLDVAQAAVPAARTAFDVGAGTGLLVRAAEKRGLSATGIEPSRWLVAQARRDGTELIQGVLPHPDVNGKTFDLVFAIDVIEHLADPMAFLRECAALVGNDGVLIVVTPDVSSLAARLLGRRWWHFRVAHVGYFNRRSFTRMCAQAGLRPVSWRRARWYFPAEYLAKRLGEYLPGWPHVDRLVQRKLPSLYNRVIPLNLHDSYVVALRPDARAVNAGG